MIKIITRCLIFIIFVISANISAEEEKSIVDNATTIINVINESKELKEESLKKYNKSNALNEKIYSADDFSLGEYVGKARDFVSNKVGGFSIDANAAIIDETTQSIRDPFNLSAQTGIQRSGRSGLSSSFLPDIRNSKIPALKLKGVVYPQSKKTEDLLALLEVNNKEVFMVKVGDEISYDSRDPNAAIKIVNISRLTITVQAGSLGNVLIVR